MPADASLFAFEVAGMPEDTFSVLAFEALESISKPTVMRILALSRSHGLEYDDLVSRPSFLRVQLDGMHEIHGVVTEFHEEPFSPEASRYEIHVQGHHALLAFGTQCRVFLDKTAPEIIQKVLEDSGLDSKHLKMDIRRTHNPIPMHVQYNETDLDFVRRTAQAAGIFFFDTIEDSESVMVVGDEPGVFPAADVDKPFEYRPGAGLVEFDLDAIFQIRRSNRMHSGTVRFGTYDPEAPGVFGRGAAEGPGQATWSTFDTSLRDSAEAAEAARFAREAILSVRERITAVTHNPRLRSGEKFTISQEHGAGFGGEYLLLEVRHEGSQEGSVLGNGGDAHYTNRVVAQPANLPYRPPKEVARPKVPGILLLKVDGADGQYAPIDDEGRYRGRFPFDEGDASEGTATTPIRLAVPYAGPGYGIHAPLHKGNDLVVAFEDGDIERPIALGALPNPSNGTPVTSANRSESQWKTATGNQLILDDLEEKTKVTLKSSLSRQLVFDDTEASAGILLSTPGARRLLLDDKNGLLELSLASGAHQLKIVEQDEDKAQATLCTGSGHILQFDDTEEKITLQTAAGHTLVLDDKGELMTFSDAKGKHVFQIDIGGSKVSLTTAGDMSFEAKGKLDVKASEVKIESTSGAIAVKAATEANIQAGSNANVKASQKLAMEAGMDAGLKAGMNLKLEGTMNVESKAGIANKMTGTMTNVESSAINTIKGAMVMIN
ncbi:MAG: type VI secretion system tip protein VgrG [Fibrobacteria bacterium]|nr:type VI secretion system tip protein VgrG [Fibrobacteria bacterium]